MFLLDSNTFIEAKNRYYAFDFAPAFWDWLDHVAQDDVRVIEPVCDELGSYSDELGEWIRSRKGSGWMLSIDDDATQDEYADIVNELHGSHYKPSAVREFLSGADPWLIAKAKVLNACVVTHEVAQPEARARVPIPNICGPKNIPVRNTFELIRLKASKFFFKP